MRKLHEPLTFPDHPELLHEINEMNVAIKLHHIILAGSQDDMKKLIKAREKTKEPEWESIVQLLEKCYKAINEQRHDPRNYIKY